MHTNRPAPAFRGLVPAMVLAGALALTGCAPASTTSAPESTGTSTASFAAAGGNANIILYNINSDGPYYRAVVTGAIGDYGPAVAVYPDGKVDQEHNSELELNLSRGTFRLDIAALDREFLQDRLAHYPDYPATCSETISFTTRVPVVAGSGTGSYRGITGEFSIGVTADEDLTDGASAAGKPCTQPPSRLWEIIVLAGSGTITR